MTSFNELGLSEKLVAGVTQLGYTTPTPIQEKAIPLLLEGRDMIGLAQTGTGKTAAFGLPIIEMLLKIQDRPANRTCRTLILAPTRELVNQIGDSLRSFVRKTPLKINQVVGGASINKQQLQLEKGTDILVATPGRLLDLISRNAISLSKVTFLVLDEADQMLDLGFIHDLRKISRMVPPGRQTLLFSATMPKAIADLAGSYLTNPVTVQVTPPGKAADKVEQYVHFVVGKNDKTELLKKTLNENPDSRSIVFLRTKHGAEKLSKYLEHIGFKVASIHGNKSQGQRERALKGFKDGEFKVLVATDVAARGIDIPAVTHVFNYDLPEVADAYVHRIGRTARAGLDGIAIAFCAPDETRLLHDIEKLMKIEIPVLSGERPAGLASPSRGNNNNRGAGNRGNANANGPRRQGGERGERAHGDRPQRGHREGGAPRDGGRRNGEFRGQRAGEYAPVERDNDLDGTSDFKRANTNAEGAAGKPAGNRNHRGGQGRPARKTGSFAPAGQGRPAGNAGRGRKRG
ncbi:DEAD/DEAH box helicase [Agrobacterium sp. rho-13.3]|uniref:DEAD/DEAH box helicase n=1 Tax=Agrobacterium sp. rho-13.3 TaxID=3072980 RepID=UPI002A16F080|nr:DEAD/DEAH box helicase [Agrobacterium sp. rho-13.3]MDX8307933.1 DEAD/DEAH box helicase [Agrobacterium sp. rho-13.3]